MPRYRSALRLRPIQRIKHVVDVEGLVDNSPVVSVDLVIASDTPDLASTPEVITGSTVHGIYLKLEGVMVGGSGRPQFYFCLFKNPGGNLAALGFDPRAIGSNDNKRFVFHQEMVMLSTIAGTLPRVIFNGVIKIPKGFSRMGPNDKLSMNIVTGSTATIQADWCAQAHYKEFR